MGPFGPPSSESGQHLRQALAFDVLHRVVVHVVIPSDSVHGNDVRMVQVGRRLRFIAKPLQTSFVQQSGQWQNLQRHSPLKRCLQCAYGLCRRSNSVPCIAAQHLDSRFQLVQYAD
jgi:hypothetical protein